MDAWSSGDKYEGYVGRWSAIVARKFVAWLGLAEGLTWLEAGCGTGALTRAILDMAAPERILATDASPDYLNHAAGVIEDPRVSFQVASAMELPAHDLEFDAVASGLMLNFVPDASHATVEMRRATRIGGEVAAYVWDYAEGMEFMRLFWDAAVALDPSASELDEGRRFPLCRPDALRQVYLSAGLREVDVQAIEIETRFSDFADFWEPFLGGQGPAPGYVASLTDEQRERLAEHLRRTAPYATDGSIPMVARAWAVRGKR